MSNDNGKDDLTLEGKPCYLAATGWQVARIPKVENLGKQNYGYGDFKFFKTYFELKQKDPTGEHIIIDKLYKNSATTAATVKLIAAAGKQLKEGFQLQHLAGALLMVDVGRRTGKKNGLEFNDVTDVKPLNSGDQNKLVITD